MRILRFLLRALRLGFSAAVSSPLWREFRSSPWRIGVFLVWALVVAPYVSLVMVDPSAYMNLTEGSSSSAAHLPFPLPRFFLLALGGVLTGFLVATIDLTADREHRFLAMLNLSLVGLLALVPVGLALGLVSIIQIAVAVAAAPTTKWVRGDGLFGNERAAAAPAIGMVRGRTYHDATVASLALGAGEDELRLAVRRAAWDLAEGRTDEAIERCAGIRGLLPRSSAGGPAEQMLAEVEAVGRTLRPSPGKIEVKTRPPDGRRALLAAWLALRSGETEAARAALPAPGAPLGPSPWALTGMAHLDLMPTAWAEDLAEAFPQEADRIRAAARAGEAP